MPGRCLLEDADQCIVASEAAIHAITASEKPRMCIHAPAGR